MLDYQGKYMMLVGKTMTKVYISKYVDHSAAIQIETKQGKMSLEIPHNSYLIYQVDKRTPYSDDLVYLGIIKRDIKILACYDSLLIGKMISGKALVKL